MTNPEVPRARPGLVSRSLVLLALASAGCSGGDYGSVSAAPKAAPDVVQVGPPTKDRAAPRVPRGPNQAKALQESKAK